MTDRPRSAHGTVDKGASAGRDAVVQSRRVVVLNHGRGVLDVSEGGGTTTVSEKPQVRFGTSKPG
jgi:hypothetical protein